MKKFEVRNEEIEELLKNLARLIQKCMPKNWGFTLLIFDYTDKADSGNMFYISSARRKDMIKAMIEFIGKQQEDQKTN